MSCRPIVCRFRSLLIPLAIVSSCVATPTSARAQGPGNVPLRQIEVRQALMALYPELRDGFVVDEQLTDGGVRVRVTERARPGDPPRATRRLLLEADVAFDGAQTIRDLRASGPLVREASNRALARRLRTEADTDSVLATETLRLGLVTREQVTGAVSLAAIRGARGNATVVGIQQVRPSRAVVGPASPLSGDSFQHTFLWRVDVLIQVSGEPDCIKSVYLEPYDGRIVRMTRRLAQ